MQNRRVQFGWRSGAAAVALALAVTVGGCANNKIGAPFSTASTKPLTREAALAEAQTLNEQYKKKPDDPAVAIRFADSLKAIGSHDQAVNVLAAATDKHSSNPRVVAAYGKSLIGVGRAGEAVEILGRAQALDPKDWRTISALGLANDHIERHQVARTHYARAAKLAPREASILNNWGLSYALDRDLPNAEKVLRKAITLRGADLRVRQNLALVVGLQGRFKDAEELARKDLPPAEAEANIAYLRAMLAEPNAWGQLAKMDKGGAGKKTAPSMTASTGKRLQAPGRTGKN